MYEQGFPWIKFAILSIAFDIPVWIWSPGLKWKLLLSLAVFGGVALALAGKSMKGVTPLGRKF